MGILCLLTSASPSAAAAGSEERNGVGIPWDTLAMSPSLIPQEDCHQQGWWTPGTFYTFIDKVCHTLGAATAAAAAPAAAAAAARLVAIQRDEYF